MLPSRTAEAARLQSRWNQRLYSICKRTFELHLRLEFRFNARFSNTVVCTRREANNFNPAQLLTAYMATGRGGDCCSWRRVRFLAVTFIKLGSYGPGENPSISFWEILRKTGCFGLCYVSLWKAPKIHQI